jgi:HEAT repeat protein
MPLLPENDIVRWLALEAQAADREVKETALDRLGTLSGPGELLVAALDDADPDVRGTAAVNLGRTRRMEALHPLLHAVRNERVDEARRHMIGALEGYSDPMIADVLLDLLARPESDYLMRMEVVTQLWKYEPAMVWPGLVGVVLGDESDIVRGHAAESLDLLDEVWHHDPARLQLWLRLADDDHPGVANIAAKVLARESTIPASSILEAIRRRLQSAVSGERAFALHRLSMLAPTSVSDVALPLLADEQQAVRVACCACLGVIREAAAIDPLLAVIRVEPEPRVKTAALLGLENYRGAAIGDALLAILEERLAPRDVLSVACRQLWKYPSERTLELLRRVLASSVGLDHRPVIESSLAFIERVVSSGPLRLPT